MILIKDNVERITDDKRFIKELKEQGYVEVKDDKRTKSKGTGKARKADSK